MDRARIASLLPRPSLRASLLLLLGCIAVLLSADRTREIMAQRQQAIVEAREDLLKAAKAGAERQAQVISQARAVLKLAARLPETASTSMTRCQPPFRGLVEDLPWLTSLSVVSVGGQVICTSSERVRATVGDRPYFQEVLRTGDFVLSDYIISRVTRRPTIIAAMPRSRGGAIDAVILGSIDISWLGRLAAETSADPRDEVLLVDKTGTVIAASPNSERMVGDHLTASPDLWSMLQHPEGVLESAATDGKSHIIGHAHLPDTHTVLAVMRLRQDVVAEADRQVRYGLGKILLTALVCFLVVWLGGERLVLRPLAALRRSAAQLGAGNFVTQVDTRNLAPELRLLGETFNSMARQLQENEKDLRRANLRLQELAATDGLTALANRRQFDVQLQAEWRRASRTGECVALITLDVDHFKKFNDRYGHSAGDGCLKQVAAALAAAARRPADVAARTGGEEFALLLPGAKLAHAAAIAEDVRSAVKALGIPHEDSEHGKVTVSVGVAAVSPKPEEDLRALIDAADAALYRAKRSGRDRVASGHVHVALAS